MLKKYVAAATHILEHEPMEIQKDLSYEEKLVQILDRKVKALWHKEVPLVKVLWWNQKIRKPPGKERSR